MSTDKHPHTVVRIGFFPSIPSAPVILHDEECDVYIAGVMEIAGVSDVGDTAMLDTFDRMFGWMTQPPIDGSAELPPVLRAHDELGTSRRNGLAVN